MAMNIITIIGVIFTVLASWIAWKEYTKKRELESLGEQISAEEYLKKCYENEEFSTWVKDNLAQKFTRILTMNHIINNRLIELHENNLINYNNLIKYYRYGHPQIRFIISDHISFIRDIQFLPIVKTSYTTEMFFLKSMYILGLIPIFISFYEFFQIALEIKSFKFFDIFYSFMLFLQGSVIIFVSFYFKRIVENANLFVTKLHEAEVQYQKLTTPKQVKKSP
ncbi:hypothetical protein [Acinetobacter pittii]|uniref:hypothetical protein n=1 Tax=Acinetobacter pittii TaxID=48296 RepID=UPI000F748EFD|nr:hypothetical protein [Acinetobacter pittii]